MVSSCAIHRTRRQIRLPKAPAAINVSLVPTSLSVIIPTWNGLRHLPRCLAALAPQLPRGAEILLVDNGSSDGTADWVRRTWPQVRLLRLPYNQGFAGGVNAGLRAARAALLLLLNDDAFAEPGFVDALLAAAQSQPRIGAVAGVLTFAHRPDLVASAGLRARTDGLALDLWGGRAVSELPTSPCPAMGASGGAALLRRALLEDIGLLEGGFFNYLEDVDLAWRALLRGWETVVAPGARALHVYSATAGQGSPLKQRLLGRNRIATIVRCLPGPLLLRCLPGILAYDALALAYAAATRQPHMVLGRIEALRMLPALLEQRRAIQSRRTAPAGALARWLEPTPPPWQTLREQRRLEAILAERGSA
jgi:GT2 family glycosyltransferase